MTLRLPCSVIVLGRVAGRPGRWAQCASRRFAEIKSLVNSATDLATAQTSGSSGEAALAAVAHYLRGWPFRLERFWRHRGSTDVVQQDLGEHGRGLTCGRCRRAVARLRWARSGPRAGRRYASGRRLRQLQIDFR